MNHPEPDSSSNTSTLNHSTSPSLRTELSHSKFFTTLTACTVAGIITYPSETFRQFFTEQALRQWNFEQQHTKVPKSQWTWMWWGAQNDKTIIQQSSHSWTRPKFDILRVSGSVASPLLRLVSFEAISVVAYEGLEPYAPSPTNPHALYEELMVGALSGISQAILLCPWELYRAHQFKVMEELEMRRNGGTNMSPKQVIQWMKSHLFEGGRGNPYERWTRAYRGVAVLALREMVFNLSFFPLFYRCKYYLDDISSTYCRRWHDFIPSRVRGKVANEKDLIQLQNCTNYVLSGLASGLICSLIVTPMDVFKTYMLHSREYFSIWNGKSIRAPPWKLLFRGLTIQAFVLGPTFGVVAAVYELT